MLGTSTRNKIAAARILSKAICLARKALGGASSGIFERRGLRYELDLAEGIDLAIYLFGAFEPEVAAYCRSVLREGDCALDVGANIGAHTLNMARIVGPRGRVVACEPTDFAFAKLKRNLSLNPGLAGRVMARQIFLAARAGDSLPAAIASSWPLNPSANVKLEPSQGAPKSTTGASVDILDSVITPLGDAAVALVKLDVDGYERDVLEGGARCLSRRRPAIVIELAPDTAARGEESLREILRLLRHAGYQSITHRKKTGSISEPEALLSRIPRGGSINVLIR